MGSPPSWPLPASGPVPPAALTGQGSVRSRRARSEALPQTAYTCRAHVQAKLPESLDPIARPLSVGKRVHRLRRVAPRCRPQISNDDNHQRDTVSKRPPVDQPPPGHPRLAAPRPEITRHLRDGRSARPAPIHGPCAHRAVRGPSQPTQQRAMTNNDTDQQAALPLVSIAFAAWTSALLGLPKDLVDLDNRALAGRADLREHPVTKTRYPAGRVDGVGRPVGLSQGRPHASPGKEPDNTVAVLSRAAPELARGQADAGPTGRSTTPACNIKTSGRRWAVKRREVLRNPEK